MNKFQKGLKFRHFNDFIEYLEGEELRLVESLRNLIVQHLPTVEERLAYNVPFYYGRKRIAYIWPSIIPWGGIDSGVALGFCQAHLMQPTGSLLRGNGKHVKYLHLFNTKKLDNVLISDLLLEAYEIDRSFISRL